MKGSVTKPDFKITIGADAGQIEANVVKAINEAVTSINKDTDTKLKKLKVQIDKEALKNQIQNSVSSVHIKQFDGLGKQIGNDIASAIKKSLANVQIGKISSKISGTSTGGTAKPSNGLPIDRNKLINSWAKQYSEQEMKLYTAVADILNRSSKMATADYEKLLDQFQAYEDNLKQFSSNLTKRERNAFDTAVKTEQSKSKYDTFHMAKQTYDNMWGVGSGSLTDVLRSIGGSVHPAVSKASYDLSKKLSSMLEYVPFDASNIDAGLDGITDKINEAVKSQISGMQILARNVKVESDSLADSNKQIDEHVDVMKLAAEAEAKKAKQSRATGDAIDKETQTIAKNNAAAKAHADILSPCQRAACVPADGIAARDAHIHRRQARNGGQIHANRAGNRRSADHAAIRPGRWQQKKRQQQSQQQRRKPFRLYHCHEKIPLSSFSLHPCRKSAKHGTNGIVSHFRPD